jgi:parallel beta-helix repeat protein
VYLLKWLSIEPGREMHLKKEIAVWFSVVLLVVFVAPSIQSATTSLKVESGKSLDSIRHTAVSAYTASSPVHIDGDQDFQDQASLNHWPGHGSQGSPYVIRNLSISSLSDTAILVNITNTDVYFEFRDSMLSGGAVGVNLWNVRYGSIINNTIQSSAENGMFADGCDHLLAENNTLKNADSGANGLYWYSVQDSIASNNTVNGNGERGLLLDFCENCSLLQNTVFANGQHGINLRDANTIRIVNNTIYSNSWDGIEMGNCPYCNITDNYIHDNAFRGVDAQISQYLRLIGNDIAGHSIDAASISGDHSYVINNTLYNSGVVGVAIDASDVTVTWNNIIDNKGVDTGIQVIDQGTGNIIDYNYYDHWTSPDVAPRDGIVDIPFQVAGDASNMDMHPRVMAFPNARLHIVTKPMITYPISTYLSYHTTINITWGPSSDTFSHSITYAINYSSDGGNDWVPLVTGMEETYYLWNITGVPESTNYSLRVGAVCSEGVIAVRQLQYTFTVFHHAVSIPYILYPNGGEHISGVCSVQWQMSQCTYHHSVVYDLYFSSDEGTSWHLIQSNIESNQYNWDTSGLGSVTQCRLKVVARCNQSASAEDVSGAAFSIVSPGSTSTTATTSTTRTGTDIPIPDVTGILLLGAGVSVVLVIVVLAAKRKR